MLLEIAYYLMKPVKTGMKVDMKSSKSVSSPLIKKEIILPSQRMAEINAANRAETKVWLLLALCAWVVLAISLWVKP